MRRRAAGRADGRLPGLDVASCRSMPTVRAVGRTVVLGAALTLLTGVVGLPPAQAAPAVPDPVTAATDVSRPVRVVVDRIEPRTVTPGAPVEVSGRLVNDGTSTYTGLSVRLQRSDVLRTRAGLHAERESADPAGATAAAPWDQLEGELAPGGTLAFSYSTTTDQLQLTEDGVYPVLVNVNGVGAEGQERVGELATQLVQVTPSDRRTTVAWLWPVTDRPHRDPSGAFLDDALAAEVAEGGRLDRVLDVLDELPRVPGEERPAVPVTLAVDPALLEELAVMAAGPYRVGDADGTGTADAAELLDRLRAAAATSVIALPYADVDADALVTAGQTAVLARSLPGTTQGTARQPGVPGTTEGTASAAGAGAAIVSDVLGVTPRTDMAWPVDGAVRPETLDALRTGGARAVVLAEDSLTGGSRAVGAEGGAAVPASTLPTAAGPVTALVADRRLADLVTDAVPGSDTARLTEQSFLAELGALATQPADAPSTLLVVPPRRVDPDPATVAAMMTDTVEQPWLTAVPVPDLAGPGADDDATAAGPAGDLVPDAGTGTPLPPAGVETIAQTARIRDDFTTAVSAPPTVVAGYDAAIARAASAGWRQDEAAFSAGADRLREAIDSLRRQVTLVAPVDGTYSLASQDAPLVLTVRNDLPFEIKVRLDVTTRENVQLTTDDIGVTTLEPDSRRTLEVPTQVRQSGGFAVTAQLRTPGGEPLGDEVRMQVRSTAYGPITLGLTIGAAALLALLFLRRGVRFVLARRRGGSGGENGGDPSPADGRTLPPTRSPV